MPKLKFKPPKYAKHKATGQAVVRIENRDRYLGRFGSPESYRKYQQAVAEWTASRVTPKTPAPRVDHSDLRICELLLSYIEFAREYYRKDGQPTGELPNMEDAMRPVRDLYSGVKIAEFGPSCLKRVRDAMVQSGLSRKVVNSRVNRVRRIFKWGVENELVDWGTSGFALEHQYGFPGSPASDVPRIGTCTWY